MKHFYFFLLLLFASSAGAQSQIPNNSFELWVDGNPVGWSTNNSLPTLVTVSQSTLAQEGQSSLHGEVKEMATINVPPFLISNTAGTYGFPMTSRPAALNGYMATDLKNGDAVFISISLVGEGMAPIGGNSHMITTSSSTLQPFSIPLFYASPDLPDTALITFTIGPSSTQAATIGSSFTLDNLSFGDASSVDRQEAQPRLIVTRIAGGFDFALPGQTNGALEIIDVNGRQVAALDVAKGTEGVRWYSAGAPNGFYIARLLTPTGMQSVKLTVVD